MANKTLGELITWLEQQDPEMSVRHGFSTPHSDRGSYCDLAFHPEETTSIDQMLENARSALGATFTGWKGGEYKMGEYTDVLIGEYGNCGENITDTHFRYWLEQEPRHD